MKLGLQTLERTGILAFLDSPQPARSGRSNKFKEVCLRRLVALTFFTCVLAWAQDTPLPETEKSAIEYKSVPDALAGLRAKPDIEISKQGGWIIAIEPDTNVIWSFAPESHPAYPALVKRAVVSQNGGVFIKMDVKCQASKSACDALVLEFIQLNKKMRSSFQSKQNKQE